MAVTRIRTVPSVATVGRHRAAPDQFRVLAQTGLGDGIVISDANFPLVPVARGTMQVVNAPDAMPTVFIPIIPMARSCDGGWVDRSGPRPLS